MGKAPVLSYRDLDAWHAAMELTVLTYAVAKRLPEEERYGLSSQIRRAAVSIPANLAEGQSCGEDGRYIHHVRTALGSAGELSTELEIVLRLKFATETDLAAVLQQLTRTRQLLFGLLRNLRKHRLLKRGRETLLAAACVWPAASSFLPK
jgi:four helix bundle protein